MPGGAPKVAEPEFQNLQRQFAAHIRDPSRPAPGDIEDRRMAIYRELFFNNIESFLSNGFPVLRSLLSDNEWQQLARAFMKDHAAASPYFVDIPAEFVRFLGEQPGVWEALPGFVLELAHYEYMEVAVGTSREEIPASGFKHDGDLLAAAPFVSPLTCLLHYRWPVHRISASVIPEKPPETPVWLLVYRDRRDEVHFMELNTTTARLLQLLEAQPLWPGRKILEQLAEELATVERAAVLDFGAQTLAELRQKEVLLGTRLSDISELGE